MSQNLIQRARNTIDMQFDILKGLQNSVSEHIKSMTAHTTDARNDMHKLAVQEIAIMEMPFAQALNTKPEFLELPEEELMEYLSHQLNKMKAKCKQLQLYPSSQDNVIKVAGMAQARAIVEHIIHRT